MDRVKLKIAIRSMICERLLVSRHGNKYHLDLLCVRNHIISPDALLANFDRHVCCTAA